MPRGVDGVYGPANEVGSDFHYAAEKPHGEWVGCVSVRRAGVFAADGQSALKAAAEA